MVWIYLLQRVVRSMIVSTPSSWLLNSWDLVKLVLTVLKSRLGNLCFWDGNLWVDFSTVAHGVEEGMEIHCKAMSQVGGVLYYSVTNSIQLQQL